MSFESLMREHDCLERMAGELRASVLGSPAPVKALNLLREFAVEIERHRGHERRSIYQPLMKLPDRKKSRLDVDLSDLVSEMDADWNDFLYNWNLELISVDWQNFAEETIRILGRAKTRLRIENCLIYPLALQEGAISLR